MLPALKVGGVYPARVVRLLVDGRVQLEIGGVRLEARAAAGMQEGTVVTVEVEHLVPTVVLRVVRSAAAGR